MDILVIGGTRFFGIPMVKELLKKGHKVTIATRGIAKNNFGNKVKNLTLERTSKESIKNALSGYKFDVVIDKIAYSSNDIKNALDVLNCDKYIYMSSTAVYAPKKSDTKENDFIWNGKELIWCDRTDFPYDILKRQAEYALWQKYSHINAVAVRYPYVIGKDDYTKRLYFYVQNTIKGTPMHIDNLGHQMGYINSDEAGKFLAFLTEKDFTGAINGSSKGTISIDEMLQYIEHKTGKKSIISSDGLNAPYNGEPEYSINTQKAEDFGFEFTDLKSWIYDLLDFYINLATKIME